jgi:hypothetical protein
MVRTIVPVMASVIKPGVTNAPEVHDFQGVTMHRPNEPGYCTSDSFVVDDWR